MIASRTSQLILASAGFIAGCLGVWWSGPALYDDLATPGVDAFAQSDAACVQNDDDIYFVSCGGVL